MTKKKVLIFIDWFLPGDRAGGPVRSVANIIDQLGDEFAFSVITRNTDYMSDKVYTGVKADEWNTVNGMRVYYFSANGLTRPNMEKLIGQEQFDLVYLNGMWSVPFTIWPLRILSKQRAKVILGVRGMLAPSAMAIKAQKKKIFLLYAKARKFYAGIRFHATTAQEAAEVKQYFGDDTLLVIAPNLPRKMQQEYLPPAHERSGELNIVTIARIAPEKNTLFALEVLSKCRSAVTADFFGTVYDEEYYGKCSALIAQLPPNVKVQFHAAVASEKIQDVIRNYDLLFLPSRGENFGHIILESMQSCVPVLISDRTPWRNLEEQHAGWDLPLSVDEFAKTIDRIAAMDGRTFENYRRGAFELAQHYSSDPSVINATRNMFS